MITERQQAVINTIRNAVLDMTGTFTIYDLLELPRTGGIMREIKATFEETHRALLTLGCTEYEKVEEVNFYLAPQGKKFDRSVFIL